MRDELIATLALDDLEHVETRRERPAMNEQAAFAAGTGHHVILGHDGAIHVHRSSDGPRSRSVGTDPPTARSRHPGAGRPVLQRPVGVLAG